MDKLVLLQSSMSPKIQTQVKKCVTNKIGTTKLALKKDSDSIIAIDSDSSYGSFKDTSFNNKDSVSDKTKVINKVNKSDTSCSEDKNDSVEEVINPTPPCTPPKGKSDTHFENTLDELYGNSWRKNKEVVLSKSVPRYKKKQEISTRQCPITERKPKKSLLYKNPYLETEKGKSQSLLRTLHIGRAVATFQSPHLNKWRDLCDSDGSSDDEPRPKVKLDFNCPESDDDYYTDKSDVENKLLDESLTTRVRRKITNKCLVECDKENVKSDCKIKEDATIERKQETVKCKDILNTKIDSEGKSNKAIKTHKVIGSNTDKNAKEYLLWKQQWKNLEDYKKQSTKRKTETLSFLASLSCTVPVAQSDPSAIIFRNNYNKHKDVLRDKLFKLFNETVFDNAIPEDTPILWNTRMTGSAGFCYCRRSIKNGEEQSRSVRIALSSKVLDSANRLRDTLIHEMCHAATWIVNEISDGHGDFWKAWAAKAMKRYPELPTIKRCHDYEVLTKYTYKCLSCGYSIGRHTKSLDTERKRCGYCHGKFEVLVNKRSKNGKIQTVPTTPKKAPTGFALFVKENYLTCKTPELNHGDVMKILGQKFAEMKVCKTG